MRSRSQSRPQRRVALLLGTALVAAALVPVLTAGSSSAAGSPGTAAAQPKTQGGKNVLVNLWEWNWSSIARECTTVLGPAGYAGVQVAPPQDSVKRTELGNGQDTILHPWWEVYQAVDYDLTSRMGTEAQFKSMVSTCRKAGVKVYVDTVINHTTGQGSLSYGGVTYSHFSYPDWTSDDFHHQGAECPSATGGIEDFNNSAQVWNCELVGLADLATGEPKVQQRLAAYLNKLIGYGVSGFRVDAAKHITPDDLLAITQRLHRTKDGTRPYIALEVFGGGPGILSPQAYSEYGNVLGLDAVKQLRDAFKSYPADHVGSINVLKVFGPGSGLVAGDRVLNFVQNHDTERNGDALNYKDGATNILANEFLLAYGYGTPQVFSSFAWDISDDSPPSTADGLITDTDCSSAAWVCTHRDPGVLGVLAWHNTVGTAPRANWWDNGGNVIAFSRGKAGWITFNNDPAAHTYTFSTGLARGTYCDQVHGTRSGSTCSGPTVRVDGAGRATVTVPGKSAVAISRASKL